MFTLTNFKVASSTSGMLQCALSVTRWLTPYSRRVSSGHTKATDTLRVTLHTARNHTYALISRLSDQQSEGQPDAQTYRFLPTIRKPHCSRSHPRESDIDQFGESQLETPISNRLYTLLAFAYRIRHCGKVDRRGPRRSSVHTIVHRLWFRGYTVPIGTSPSRARNSTNATNDSRIPCDSRSRCFDISRIVDSFDAPTGISIPSPRTASRIG